MASVIIPKSPPFRIAAGGITPEVTVGLYSFDDYAAEESYDGVPRAGVMPLGALSLAYLTMYNLPHEGGGRIGR